MSESHRRLPHIYPEGRWLFITWHLHGSLPIGRFPPPGKQSDGQAFVWMDRYLDTTREGPMFLHQESIALVVQQQLELGVTLGHYQLSSYVIMGNHVHALLLPKIEPPRMMQVLKGATARAVNLLLNRQGRFWQAESYDHWVRSENEYVRI